MRNRVYIKREGFWCHLEQFQFEELGRYLSLTKTNDVSILQVIDKVFNLKRNISIRLLSVKTSYAEPLSDIYHFADRTDKFHNL